MRSTVFALLLVATLPLPAADEAEKERWTRLPTPEFELSTSAGEKTGKETLLQFEQVRGFFLNIWPERAAADVPLRILVFKTREQFAPYTECSSGSCLLHIDIERGLHRNGRSFPRELQHCRT